MVTQRNDDTYPGVCPPLPHIGFLLGRNLERLGVDCRRPNDCNFEDVCQRRSQLLLPEAVAPMRVVIDPMSLLQVLDVLQLTLRMRARNTVAEWLVGVEENFLETAR